MDGTKIVSMKMITGEEVICRAISINEDISEGIYTFTIRDPFKVEYSSRKRKIKCNLTPWFILSDDNEHMIDASIVVGIAEVKDPDVLEEYSKLVPTTPKLLEPPKRIMREGEGTVDKKENTSGYVGDTLTTRSLLEKIYKADSADRA